MSLSDDQIVDSIAEIPFSMSKFQMENFVVKSQITDFRQVKQTLLELSGRYDNMRQSEVDLEKREIERDRLKHKIETAEDPFDKRLFELELKEQEKDIKRIIRIKKTQEHDYNFFADKIKERFKTKQELIDFFNNPEEERKYWIARLGKQAALDLLSTGRIGNGNMDSIAMMDEDDQVKVLTVAVQYSGLMNVGMQKLQQKYQPYLKDLHENSNKIIPTFDNIESNLNVKLISDLKNDAKFLESFQFTDKPES